MIVITSKTSGNSRIDHDNALQSFSTLRQKPGESVSDFQIRMETIVQSFTILKIDPPSAELQGMRFIQGLEHSRFNTLQAYLVNEIITGGRDLYPANLTMSWEKLDVRDCLGAIISRANVVKVSKL